MSDGASEDRLRPRCLPVRELPADIPRVRSILTHGPRGRDLLLGMDDRGAEGLAGVLPAMVCGEESAVMVFDNERRRTSASLFSESSAMLGQIAREEEVHEAVLRSAAEALPVTGHDALVRRQARRFFLSLHTEDIGTHFSRIAWLDSGVCVILTALLRRGLPLAAAPHLSTVLKRIVLEEAHHVRFSRDYAARLSVHWRDDQESFHRVRAGLVQLLEPCGAALESLEVDPAHLFRRLKTRGTLGESR